MSDELKAVEYDVLTGEYIERALTKQELADLKVSADETKAIKKEQKAKEIARSSATSKLLELGLTAEEIAAL